MAETQHSHAQSNLPEPVMPTLAQTASRASRGYQRRSRLAVALALILVILATVISLFQGLHRTITVVGRSANVAAIGASAAFLLALVVRLVRMVVRPERIWYDSRSLSEQVKSLAWTYAVGGGALLAPSGANSSEPGRALTAEQYEHSIKVLVGEALRRKTPIRRSQRSAPVQNITDWMEATRRKSLAERIQVYQSQRIGNQQQFYSQRASRFGGIASRWNIGLLFLEGGGVAAAFLRAIDVLQFDLIGVAGTLAAAGTAWIQFNQFTTLSNTYAAMEYKLADFQRRCQTASWTEETWATFVRDVEDLLGAEHSIWRQTVLAYPPDGNQPILLDTIQRIPRPQRVVTRSCCRYIPRLAYRIPAVVRVTYIQDAA